MDGRAFHTFTKNMNRPFDDRFIQAMVQTAVAVASEMQGFKAAYVQSDEATFLLTDYDELTTQGWFVYNLQKIVSISASLMSVNFIRALGTSENPVFDSRAFNVPKEDVVNTFLWRAQDWQRNSLQMYSRAFFSHRELIGRDRSAMHNMLHTIDKNWATDLSNQYKNGTFLLNTEEGIITRTDVFPTYQSIAEVLDPVLGVSNGT